MFNKGEGIMLKDAITTVGFALQSYVNTCIHEDTEENRAERVELTLAWSIIKKHLEEKDT
jgi:hypothetical protein